VDGKGGYQMLTNAEIESLANPLEVAKKIQERIVRLKMELAGDETELNQIILYCKEKGISSKGGYAVRVQSREIRTIIPEKFRDLFPKENQELLSKYVAFVGRNLDNMVETRILPSINIKDAEQLVGSIELDDACNIKKYESVSIIAESEK
jgi:hypothetical protein